MFLTFICWLGAKQHLKCFHLFFKQFFKKNRKFYPIIKEIL